MTAAPATLDRLAHGRSGILIVLLFGALSQAVWLAAVPFSWTWDSATNLAIGRFYFHLPAEHWSVWQYYAPGYGIFLALLGVHHLDTLAGVRIGTLLVGTAMPCLLFLMMRPFAPRAAFVTAIVYALAFANAVFSTNLLVYQLSACSLLLVGIAFSRALTRPSIGALALLALAAVFAHAMRQVGLYVFAAAVLALAVASVLERRRILHALGGIALLVAVYLGATAALSFGRQAVLGGPFQFGLARDIGARVALQGAYYAASRYMLETGDDPALLRPDNGPASKQLFDGLRTFFRAGGDMSRLSPAGDVDEALQRLIDKPDHITNSYLIWWGIDFAYGIDAGDDISRRAVIEALRAQPRLVRYYLWNFWQSLFGLPMNMNYMCATAPCFYAEVPQFNTYGFTEAGDTTFAKNAGPNLIAEMKAEHQRARDLRPFGEAVFAVTRIPFQLKPLLSLLLLGSFFVTRGPTRMFALFCVLAVLANNATTSLAWPLLPRYWDPVLPFVFAAAGLTLAQVPRLFLAWRHWRPRLMRDR